MELRTLQINKKGSDLLIGMKQPGVIEGSFNLVGSDLNFGLILPGAEFGELSVEQIFLISDEEQAYMDVVHYYAASFGIKRGDSDPSKGKKSGPDENEIDFIIKQIELDLGYDFKQIKNVIA